MKKVVTIANGASLSAAVDFDAICRLTDILMDPVGWDAANITFQVSEDNTTFLNMFDDAGNEVTVTSPTTGKAMSFRNDLKRAFSRYRFIKVRSGTSGAPVNQTALRTLTLLADDPNRV